MGSSSVISPEDVLESLMNDGTIDSLRLKIINQLKANEELKSTTIKMAEQSRVLNTPGAEKQTKRELFDALRQELETQVLEKASKSVWELILDNNGMGKEINQTVERVFCKLSGREPPLFPPQQDADADADVNVKGNTNANANVKDNANANTNANAKGKGKANGKGKVKGKGKGKEKAKEAASEQVEAKPEEEKSNSKKRSFSEVNAQGEGDGEPPVRLDLKVEAKPEVEAMPQEGPVAMAEDPQV
ncbi:hypothetical protein RchiOBHm_Chr3g0457001 [Rosa chinensis]|uniref:Uncharacterized protein n=1 Tax=Rosa chinensis TaxID=74649 RepID=A0A2P6R7J1_ROSCH|nr:uncharacterized protein LOC112194719 [Rosa chinensis]PRQ42377.1 hypothetical protein RchiOBHm_Chr3g0457001 [Rosa chinensis]